MPTWVWIGAIILVLGGVIAAPWLAWLKGEPETETKEESMCSRGEAEGRQRKAHSAKKPAKPKIETKPAGKATDPRAEGEKRST